MVSTVRGDDNLDSGFFDRSWVNETGNRNIGTTYTNNLAFPIEVAVTVQRSSGTDTLCSFSIDGGTVLIRNRTDDTSGFASATATIPIGSTYTVGASTGNTIQSWGELK